MDLVISPSQTVVTDGRSPQSSRNNKPEIHDARQVVNSGAKKYIFLKTFFDSPKRLTLTNISIKRKMSEPHTTMREHRAYQDGGNASPNKLANSVCHPIDQYCKWPTQRRSTKWAKIWSPWAKQTNAWAGRSLHEIGSTLCPQTRYQRLRRVKQLETIKCDNSSSATKSSCQTC